MAKSKSQEKREKIQKESAGCETCNNTGLEVGVALSEAKKCPVCNGSPFGEHEVESKDESNDESDE